MEFLPEIYGLGQVKQHLHTLLVGERLPNGILLAGDDGRGKSTLARAFARAILCGDADGIVPEGASAATKFDAGTHADYELVIDRIRSLKLGLSLTSVEGRRRVAVIVGAEQMTQEAGNALLKILEEPPPDTHLILTGRSREAVMETLVSRCLVIPVPPASVAETEAFLLSRGLDERRAAVLSSLSEGRCGFALSLALENLDTDVLIPGALLMLDSGPPMERARGVHAMLRGDGLHGEQVRSRFRLLMAVLGAVIRGLLKVGLGGHPRDLAVLPGPVREALADLPPELLERRLRTILRALSDVNRNVSVELLLQQMLLEWSEGVATM
jgi:hypothetical protein